MFIEFMSCQEGERVSILPENVISYKEIGKSELKKIKKHMSEEDMDLEHAPNCFVETKGEDYLVKETYDEVKAKLLSR